MNDDRNPKNKFKVPKRTWGSWTLVAKHVFNKTFEYSMKNQDLFMHPKSEPITPEHFKTTAWNIAWTAASICSRGERALIKDAVLGE
ncbi:MAG: hypothetical protein AB7W16_15645 [Candidatus Obscuribacterales bacterium]